MIFPVASGWIASAHGVNVLFAWLAGVLAVSIGFVLLYRDTLKLLSS